MNFWIFPLQSSHVDTWKTRKELSKETFRFLHTDKQQIVQLKMKDYWRKFLRTFIITKDTKKCINHRYYLLRCHGYGGSHEQDVEYNA